jgi:C4-dicarboxylate-specific signal transduction histidine kinase
MFAGISGSFGDACGDASQERSPRPSVDRAREIVSRIREHIKKAPPREDRVDLNEAIADVIGMAANAAEKNGVSIRTDFLPDKAFVFGDRVQLQQVVLNR